MPSLWLDGDGHRVGISRPKVQGISSVFSFMYYSLDKYIWCTYYTPGTLVGSEGTGISRDWKKQLHGAYSSEG